MIHWNQSQLTEPPFLKDYSDDDDLKQFQDTPLLLPIPSNTQFVERMIKVITAKGTASASSKVRDGMAKATIESRKEMPRLKTKEDFLKRCSL